jgi:hypothetical protein
MVSSDVSKCESCRERPIAEVIEDDDPIQPYYLCHVCSEHIRKRALRPREWYNLAAIHGWRKYLLHDDFYDQDGTACQPDSDEYVANELLPPSLQEVIGSVETLIDYCVTRWQVEPTAHAAFGAFPIEAVLEALERRAKTPNLQTFEVCLGIAASALGTEAAAWVLAQYERACVEDVLFAWAEAAAGALPAPKGLNLTIEALDARHARDLRERMAALLWFESPIVLDWLEAHVPQRNITGEWGHLAALSSLSWERVQAWLASGRPLSLVAVDALTNFIFRPAQSAIIKQRRPSLKGCEDRLRIRAVLEDCIAKDDAPRIAQRCKFILDNLDDLSLA